MPIARITGSGVAAIAVAVALLWTFVIADHFAAQEAMAQRVQVLRELREMQRRGGSVPVAVPFPLAPHRFRPFAG